jgi:hypothetical protein
MSRGSGRGVGAGVGAGAGAGVGEGSAAVVDGLLGVAAGDVAHAESPDERIVTRRME